MIFSHMQKPLGMRKTRIGKRIYVHGVPLDTSWFCPYCCATVDTACVTPRGTGSRTRTSARLTHLLGYSGSPLSFGDVSGRNHKETSASWVVSPASATSYASRSVSSRGSAERHKELKPRSGLEPLTCSLRVITQALQGCAGDCKCHIFRGVSFLRVAACCTVLRSRWYQSGIRTSDSYSPTAGPMASPRDLRSHNPPTPVSRCCRMLQNPLI
jgi:hypothetical protein